MCVFIIKIVFLDLKLTIAAPYWLVNKSGLPLVFRQDGARTDSAGQFEEHELARSLTPLLFSFADKESPNLYVLQQNTCQRALKAFFYLTTRKKITFLPY